MRPTADTTTVPLSFFSNLPSSITIPHTTADALLNRLTTHAETIQQLNMRCHTLRMMKSSL